MKNVFTALLLFLLSTSACNADYTYTDLMNSLPLQRYSGNPIIQDPYSGLPWQYAQAFDPVVITDPNDPTKLIMYLSGMYYGNGTGGTNSGEMSIGIFTASASNPFVWTPYTDQPILRGGNAPYVDYNPASPAGTGMLQARSGWDWWSSSPGLIPGLRMGGIVQQGGTIYMSYCGGPEYGFRPGLATSTDGYHFTKSGSALYPANEKFNGVNDNSGMLEISLEDPILFYEAGTWYIYYSYIGGTSALNPEWSSHILNGIRVLTASSPYGPWTKLVDGGGVPVDIIKKGSTYDAGHIEWHQVYKIAGTYVLIYECLGSDNIYRIAMAHSSSPTSGWVKDGVILNPSPTSGAWDSKWVATASIANLNGSPYLVYCGCSNATGGSGGFWSLALAKFPGLTSSIVSAVSSAVANMRANFQ